MRALLRLPVLALLAGPLAAQIHVPGDVASLQDAIDLAAPGDVILVQGSHQGVVVDKPLTILGDPSFSVTMGCAEPSPFGGAPHGFELDGPGSGTVVLGGFAAFSADCFQPGSGVAGGGFDALHLHDVQVTIDAGQTGLGHGASAVDVTVPLVLVTGSTLRAEGSDVDHCSGFLYTDEVAGVRAPGATVVLVDSVVDGGDGGLLCCASCACPAMPQPSLGGEGGAGVVADTVLLSGSTTVEGGAGATYHAYPFGSPYFPAGEPTACGAQADGDAFQAEVVEPLPEGLSATGSTALGGLYTFTADLPAATGILFFTAHPEMPVFDEEVGWLLGDPACFIELGPVAGGAPQTFSFAVPVDDALLGQEFVLQVWTPELGLSGPLVGVVTP